MKIPVAICQLLAQNCHEIVQTGLTSQLMNSICPENKKVIHAQNQGT